MIRLDKDRQDKLEPVRIDYAKHTLEAFGYSIIDQDNTSLSFLYKGNKITLYCYSGWFTGKGIKDGRGINNLIKQLK